MVAIIFLSTVLNNSVYSGMNRKIICKIIIVQMIMWKNI